MKIIDEVAAFMKASGQTVHETVQYGHEDQTSLYMDLVEEEFYELLEAFELNDIEGISKESFDLIWVVIGLCLSKGIPLDEVWKVSAESNLAKIQDGKVIKNSEGKVMKPAGWTPPNIKKVLENR